MANKVEVVDSKIAALEFERENGNLFDLTQEQRVHLLKYEGELLDFRPQLVTSFTALDRLNGITKERDIKIKAILDDLREQSDQIKIAQNVSVLYLTVLEIGERECWTQAQIAEVFTKQLDFNHEVSVVTKDLAKKRLRGGELPSNRVIGAAYNKLAKRIPSWYKLDTMAWQNFIFSSFATQLNIEKEQLSGICSSSIGRLEGTYRITDDNILPDWMNNVDIETGNPDKDIVTYDLKEDEQAKQRLVEQFEYLASKKGYLAESARSKGRKTISRNADKYRRLFPYDELDLAQFVMFLANTDGMTYYDVDSQSIDQLSPTQINEKALQDKQKEEWFIRRFAETADLSEEMVRIFLKKRLEDMKFFDGTQEERARKIAAVFSDFGQSKEIAALRAVDKKTAQRLTFDVRPMLAEMDQLELGALQLKFVNNPFASRNEFVTEIACEIVNSFWSGSNDKDIAKFKADYKKFVVNWLKNNWRSAYAALYHRLHNSDIFDSPTPNQTVEETALEESEDIESAITEIKMGSLLDWRVVFDVNKNGDTRMEELEGDSLDALESRLEELLIKHRISCSIKLSSVIHTLEWAAGLPQEVLQLMIRETVNGQEYLKIKRGNIRLFFQINQSQKRLVFFVYQKQDKSYHF